MIMLIRKYILQRVFLIDHYVSASLIADDPINLVEGTTTHEINHARVRAEK